MNFYFTSQQVTSGLMPVHIEEEKKWVSAHWSNIEMKTHKHKKTGMPEQKSFML